MAPRRSRAEAGPGAVRLEIQPSFIVPLAMDLDQLHTFLEIVRLKSFSKAAQTCYRTQPAISAQVRQLEQELNTSLFERLGTRIALTMAGKIFAEYSEQILIAPAGPGRINELERVPRGELVIAANEATCIYVLPKVFSEYKKQFPNVQFSLTARTAYGWCRRSRTTSPISGSRNCRCRRRSCRW